MTSHNAALIIAQQAIALLLKWVGSPLPSGCHWPQDTEATQRAKTLLSWSDMVESADPPPIGVLQLLFDQVQLQESSSALPQHYVPLAAIADSSPPIPYPIDQEPNPEAIARYQQQVKANVLAGLADPATWQNLPLLMLLLEKYGSCLSFGAADVALMDQVRMVGAIAASLAPIPDANELLLIAGDISGIQSFIYTISSAGALKSLRARSFYLELLTEEIVQQLLEQLSLPRTNVIYAGGGNLFILAPASADTGTTTKRIRQRLNRWLLEEFQGKLSFALTQQPFPTDDLAAATFAEHWEEAIKSLAIQKQQKFRHNIDRVLAPRDSYEQCRVCHRDDTEDLQPLKGEDGTLACPTCRMLFDLGDRLFDVASLVRSHSHEKGTQDNLYRLKFQLDDTSEPVYYHLFRGKQPVVQGADVAFLINDWTIKNYQFGYFQGNAVPLLLGNYAQTVTETDPITKRTKDRFIQAEELAERSAGIPRVGYLRMDVDRLGQIFAKGLGLAYSLPRLAGLSRQMSYFFKVYLNSLAENRRLNAVNTLTQPFGVKNSVPPDDPQSHAQNLLFIYAGGDDVFVSGSWNEVGNFAIDIYQSFRQYTGQNRDITLSGGISLAGPKFPLYQAASESGEAEHAAKANGRDSLDLFGQAFKWSEWLGCDHVSSLKDLTILDESDRAYLGSGLEPEVLPPWFGIYPFVQYLQEHLERSLSRGFVRNLLATAQLQEQAIKRYEEKHQLESSARKDSDPSSVLQQELKGLRYYLHLPKVAYTLARLSNNEVRGDPNFRLSLLSPYNAPYFRAIATWLEFLNRR
ncbi:MAG: type III-A CRISPR-associated protein Cas10/Csm1 [Cyanothece sp. SIO2G6]|nr:type III-A CRISPR-associated protein Cas10/Csm1 [Cyanothece sp. SIO2G6]